MSRVWWTPEDFSLNISREMLQHDRQLKLVATGPGEEDLLRAVRSMLNNDREKYEEFFQNFRLAVQVRACTATMARSGTQLQDLVLLPLPPRRS